MGQLSQSFVYNLTNMNRKNNIQLYGEGQREFKQEKLI